MNRAVAGPATTLNMRDSAEGESPAESRFFRDRPVFREHHFTYESAEEATPFADTYTPDATAMARSARTATELHGTSAEAEGYIMQAASV